MRNIDTDRRSLIPLRMGYLFIAVLVLTVTAIFLLDKGFWGIFAFCCVNAPLLVFAVCLKDGSLRRFNDGLSSLAELLWPLS